MGSIVDNWLNNKRMTIEEELSETRSTYKKELEKISHLIITGTPRITVVDYINSLLR